MSGILRDMTPGPGRVDRSFERLYRRHVGDVYRYSLALLRNPADAEDVTQTTFLNAYRAIERGEQPRASRPWLIAIAHNVCRQRFRQAQRRVPEVAFDETAAEALVADSDAPTADEIRDALGHLAFNQRAALVMRELEGRSYAEIAEALGLTAAAVETLLFRARRALREQLEERLTCHEAELAISRQLDGELPRGERGALRAHLRECEECRRLARRQRGQRTAFRALALVPVPSSLAAFGGGGAAATAATTTAVAGGGVATGLAAKAAAVAAAGAVAVGAGAQIGGVGLPAGGGDRAAGAASKAPPAHAAGVPVRARGNPPGNGRGAPRAGRPAPPGLARQDRAVPPAATAPRAGAKPGSTRQGPKAQPQPKAPPAAGRPVAPGRSATAPGRSKAKAPPAATSPRETPAKPARAAAKKPARTAPPPKARGRAKGPKARG